MVMITITVSAVILSTMLQGYHLLLTRENTELRNIVNHKCQTIILSLYPCMSSLLITFSFLSSLFPMVCRNICERLYPQKMIFGISNYSLGQKYCRRCEVYLYNEGMFCPCCGMQLRLSPSSTRYKEILRKRKRIG